MTADSVRGIPKRLLHYICINKPTSVCLLKGGGGGDEELERQSDAHTQKEGGRAKKKDDA